VLALIPLGWEDLISQGTEWLHRNAARASGVHRLAVLPELVGDATAAAIGSRADLPSRRWPLHAIVVALAGVTGWIALLLPLWFVQSEFNATGHRADLLRLAEILVLVWVLIRLSSMLVRDERLARAMAVVAWIVAALNIAGLFTPVVDMLDAMAMPVGNYRISVLLVLKGGVA
jgi:hypothetical protein